MSGPSRVLCFGTSNTWGSNPVDRSRHAAAVRWPGVMAAELQGRIEIIEEGLRGRMIAFEEEASPGRRAMDYLRPCLMSHQPLDMLIIELGTNDIKRKFGATPQSIAKNLEALIEVARGVPLTSPDDRQFEIVIVAPPGIGTLKAPFAPDFPDDAAANAAALAPEYKALAARTGCHFFDAGAIVTAPDTDGLHLEAAQHLTLGTALARFVAGTVLPAPLSAAR
ncbi:MAG: GDSL-type esterase/lipase family protein [Pseudolabrys sp.]|nr:GDSL-type esterase/lipase family protein [Pseudolabrys sp.]